MKQTYVQSWSVLFLFVLLLCLVSLSLVRAIVVIHAKFEKHT